MKQFGKNSEKGNIKITENTYRSMDKYSEGICLHCGTSTSGVEPDARQYSCEECEKPAVYGVQELLMMGTVKIVNSEDESNFNN